MSFMTDPIHKPICEIALKDRSLTSAEWQLLRSAFTTASHFVDLDQDTRERYALARAVYLRRFAEFEKSFGMYEDAVDAELIPPAYAGFGPYRQKLGGSHDQWLEWMCRRADLLLWESYSYALREPGAAWPRLIFPEAGRERRVGAQEVREAVFGALHGQGGHPWQAFATDVPSVLSYRDPHAGASSSARPALIDLAVYSRDNHYTPWTSIVCKAGGWRGTSGRDVSIRKHLAVLLAEDSHAVWFHVLRSASSETLQGLLRTLDAAVTELSDPKVLREYLAEDVPPEPWPKRIAFHICVLNPDLRVSLHRILDYDPARSHAGFFSLAVSSTGTSFDVPVGQEWHVHRGPTPGVAARPNDQVYPWEVAESFWLYESWGSGPRRATIHVGSCGFCKEGRGSRERGSRLTYGRWHGPFAYLAEARWNAEVPPSAIIEHRCCARRAAPDRPNPDEETSEEPAGAAPPPAAVLPPNMAGIARQLTQAFTAGDIDLSSRPQTALVGWEGLPEAQAAARLRDAGASDVEVRLFLTFTCAVIRTRDAEHIWAAATELFLAAPLLFDPQYVLEHEETVAAGLCDFAVGQPDGRDLETWVSLARRLAPPDVWESVRSALYDGEQRRGGWLVHDAAALGRIGTRRGLLWMARKPSVEHQWVRMLAYPGAAYIGELWGLPVAVDAQARQASEFLGMATTQGMRRAAARPIIQRAWYSDVDRHGAVGPNMSLKNTGAALDPALRFLGKHGCSYCAGVGRRVPVADVCANCVAVFPGA